MYIISVQATANRFDADRTYHSASSSTKYCIGVLIRIPVSIGNILKYWFLTDPTKYWNILEIMGSLAPPPEFHPDMSHDLLLFFKKLGGLGQFGVCIA